MGSGYERGVSGVRAACFRVYHGEFKQERATEEEEKFDAFEHL